MKKFSDNVFKPYIFPIILLIIGAYLKIGDNFKGATEFFAEQSNSILKSFNYQFYVWEILIYLASAYLILFVVQKIRKGKGETRETKRMRNVIKKSPNKMNVENKSTGDKYLFKFKASVEDEEYVLDKLQAYCLNCQDKPIVMDNNRYDGTITCQCNRQLEYEFSRNVRNQIKSELEANTFK